MERKGYVLDGMASDRLMKAIKENKINLKKCKISFLDAYINFSAQPIFTISVDSVLLAENPYAFPDFFFDKFVQNEDFISKMKDLIAAYNILATTEDILKGIYNLIDYIKEKVSDENRLFLEAKFL